MGHQPPADGRPDCNHSQPYIGRKIKGFIQDNVEGRTQPIFFQSDIPVENNYAVLILQLSTTWKAKTYRYLITALTFSRGFQARHTFDNGQSEPVTPVSYSAPKGDTVLFIKYTGQAKLRGLRRKGLCPERRFYYYFSPYYSGAEFYFAYCYHGGFRAEGHIQILKAGRRRFFGLLHQRKELPDSMTITSASGKEMQAKYNYKQRYIRQLHKGNRKQYS